jgi:hypothetical protein
MATKKFFFSLGTFFIKDGSEIRFWEDRWLRATSLREQYTSLYNILRHKGDTIAKVLETSPLNVSFRRDLSGPCILECLTSMFSAYPFTTWT